MPSLASLAAPITSDFAVAIAVLTPLTWTPLALTDKNSELGETFTETVPFVTWSPLPNSDSLKKSPNGI